MPIANVIRDSEIRLLASTANATTIKALASANGIYGRSPVCASKSRANIAPTKKISGGNARSSALLHGVGLIVMQPRKAQIL